MELFQQWKHEPCLKATTPFLACIVMEDIMPCLHFANESVSNWLNWLINWLIDWINWLYSFVVNWCYGEMWQKLGAIQSFFIVRVCHKTNSQYLTSLVNAKITSITICHLYMFTYWHTLYNYRSLVYVYLLTYFVYKKVNV